MGVRVSITLSLSSRTHAHVSGDGLNSRTNGTALALRVSLAFA
jgi:hypothetical protein